jgi:hypothetical protein
MSALGHKQTCAAQNGMSAFPSVAIAKAKFRKRPWLLAGAFRCASLSLSIFFVFDESCTPLRRR